MVQLVSLMYCLTNDWSYFPFVFRILGRAQPGLTCSSVCLHRLCFSTIDSTVADHTNGLGLPFQAARNSLIACRSSTLRKTPRQMRLPVSSPKHHSTKFGLPELVGTK